MLGLFMKWVLYSQDRRVVGGEKKKQAVWKERQLELLAAFCKHGSVSILPARLYYIQTLPSSINTTTHAADAMSGGASERELALYSAKLSEQAERYPDM